LTKSWKSGGRIEKVIQDKAGYARPDDVELASVFGQYPRALRDSIDACDEEEKWAEIKGVPTDTQSIGR